MYSGPPWRGSPYVRSDGWAEDDVVSEVGPGRVDVDVDPRNICAAPATQCPSVRRRSGRPTPTEVVPRCGVPRQPAVDLFRVVSPGNGSFILLDLPLLKGIV